MADPPPTGRATAGETAREHLVDEGEAGLRLDRWFRRHYPGLPHSRLEKLLRGGQVRIDGRRAQANARLEPGQRIRIPPLDPGASSGGRPGVGDGGKASAPTVSAKDGAALRARVLYRDNAVIVLDKPAGLAVQGGSNTRAHLDGMLDLLAEGGERPRLVHRLDRDTSGVIVLAAGAAAAAVLSRAFRERSAHKLYWAVVVGVPDPAAGRIDLPLAKRPSRGGERMFGDVGGDRAVTEYAVVERAGRQAAWVELSPLTGRTHQLRVHCAAIGTPILGDGKYGGRAAFLRDAADIRTLHLHARSLTIPHPDGGTLSVEAPLPAHMRTPWARFGFTDTPPRPPHRQPVTRPGRSSSAVAATKHAHQRRQHDHGARQRQSDRDRQK